MRPLSLDGQAAGVCQLLLSLDIRQTRVSFGRKNFTSSCKQGPFGASESGIRVQF